MSLKLVKYTDLLGEIKKRIRQGQTRAVFAANSEIILTYWDIGRLILDKQEREGWGASVIPRLSRDIRNDLPEVKGFSERNIGRMIAFYRTYPTLGTFLPQPVAKLQTTGTMSVTKVPQPAAQIPAVNSSDVAKPIGVSEYELTRALPDSLKSALPSVEDIERELEEPKKRRKK